MRFNPWSNLVCRKSSDLTKTAPGSYAAVFVFFRNTVQWNPSIVATVGEWHFGCYKEVAVVEGFHCIRAATVGEWHFFCYTEVAVVEG